MSQLPARREKQANALRKVEDDALNYDISSFESETHGILKSTSLGRSATIVYSIFSFFIVMIIFCAVAKIDKVVTADGRLIPSGGQLYISPLTPGIVKGIKVKTGDIVKKGAVLAELDSTFSKADLTQLEEKMKADTAKLARLEAEQSGKPMTCNAGDRYLLLECSLWRQRQTEFQASMTAFDAQLGAAKANIQGGMSDINQYTRRMDIATNVQNIYSPLASEGYVSKLDVAKADDGREELKRQLEARRQEVGALQKGLANVNAQRANYVQVWRSAVEADIVQVSGDMASNQQLLEKAQKQFDLETLTAPEDGIVLRVGKISTGSVADRSGANPEDDALITLAPLNMPLEAELAIQAKDIGFIRPGDVVALRMSAYNYVRHGTLEGTVRTISEGSFSFTDDNRPVAPYFKVRVTLGAKKLRAVPSDFRLIPGLTLDGDILVGKRTILSYLIDGAVRTGKEAMREPE